MNICDKLAKIPRFIFLKLTLYTCTFCWCLGWWGWFKSWGWGFPHIGLWGCHKDCFEGWVWIIGLDCGVPIKTNQGSGVTFGTCLLQRSLALYPESPICIYNIISQLSWRQKLILSQKQVFSWSCKIRWEMSEKVQQKSQAVKYGGGST